MGACAGHILPWSKYCHATSVTSNHGSTNQQTPIHPTNPFPMHPQGLGGEDCRSSPKCGNEANNEGVVTRVTREGNCAPHQTHHEVVEGGGGVGGTGEARLVLRDCTVGGGGERGRWRGESESE